MPLRYNISSWDQLVGCMSNNSNLLHIKVKKLLNDKRLNGTIIEVYHDEFGPLFCYLVDGQGPVLESSDPLMYELPCATLLRELERFGFLVTFNCKANLPEDQLEYLYTLSKLGFDKIRIMYVYTYTPESLKSADPHVVVFNTAPNPGWLDNTYTASQSEYRNAISQGTAIDISGISETKRFHWDWLDYVGSIQDILNDNRKKVK